MAARRQRHWAQWIWLLAGAAVAVRVGFIFWAREEPAVAPPAAQSRPRVTVVAESGAAAGPLVREQMELFDQQPLSMPTRWNAGDEPLPDELQRQPGEAFGMFEPRLAFAAERLDPVFGPKGGAPVDSRGGLRILGAMAGGWAGLGRVDRPVPRLAPREAAVEVRLYTGGNGALVLSEALHGLPEAVRAHDWAPVEFSVVVEPAGLLGVPTLTLGSGVEEVDASLGGFLARDFRLGERLAPGFYRVSVLR